MIILLPGLLQQSIYCTTEGDATNELTQTYENPDYHVRIEYPTNCTAKEIDLSPRQVVTFIPNEFSEEYGSPVGLYISASTSIGPSNNLSDMTKVYDKVVNGDPDTRFVNDTNATALSELPAYSITCYDYARGGNQKVMDTMTVLDNERYHIQYSAESGYFDKYQPQIKRMIDSFQITSRNATNFS